MQNLTDDQRVKRFFFRLDEPLRGMPTPDRDDLHTELHQHLETLVAVQLELGASLEEAIASALGSFGNPTNVGRKLMREWRLKNRDSFWLTVAIIGVCQFAASFLIRLWVSTPSGAHWFLDRGITSQFVQVFNFISPLVPVLAGVVVGFRLPERALSGAFFAGMLASIIDWFFFTVAYRHIWMMPSFGVSGMECLAAYVVSSIKRQDWTLQIR